MAGIRGGEEEKIMKNDNQMTMRKETQKRRGIRRRLFEEYKSVE